MFWGRDPACLFGGVDGLNIECMIVRGSAWSLRRIDKKQAAFYGRTLVASSGKGRRLDKPIEAGSRYWHRVYSIDHIPS
jgi:hypothetical protein